MTEFVSVPLNKLVPSPANVRRTGRETGIEALAASIAAHGLLQNLTVRPVLDDDGAETGKYEVVAGARRFAVLKQLAKAKRIGKSAPVACAVQTAGDPVEVSLAENVTQLPMHPADQYEAFAALNGQGMTADDIAGRFGLTAGAVRQRMKLGAISPVLMQIYRDGGMNLEQLMTFTLTDDHARQERVWSDLAWNKSRDMIRRLLTEGQVPAGDRRALFVGPEAYTAAGGVIVRDLFDDADGGFFADATLLERLVRDKLDAAAQEIAAEGWKWITVHPEFNYGLAAGLRRIYPDPLPLDEADQERLDGLETDLEALSLQHEVETASPLVEAELDQLHAEIDALRGREAYRPDDVARGGAFVALGHDGALRVERGFIRTEDELRIEEPGEGEGAALGAEHDDEARPVEDHAEPEESDGLTPLSDKLIEELTSERTAALQDCLAGDPDVALSAMVHALALRLFYALGHDPQTCLKIQTTPFVFGNGVGDGAGPRAVAERHEQWARTLPKDSAELWSWLVAQDQERRLSLLAFCAARTVSAVRQPWSHEPQRLAHADALASAVGLDMAAYWSPTVDNYLGRVTKVRILEAVREGASERDADTLANLTKPDMAGHAERLLADKQWLPDVLRTRSAEAAASVPAAVAAE